MRKAGKRKPLDKVNTCPFLVRIFYKFGAHHNEEAFAEHGNEPVNDELQVYSWPDVTLHQLADLVKDVVPEARWPTATLHFSLISPNKIGRNVMNDLGSVHSSKRMPDDDKPLFSSKFQIGDFLDVAIMM